MRQRHATAPPASVTPATERRGGVKRRVTASSQAAPDQNDLPFNKCMRRDWAKGYLPAKKVVEYAKASSDQGASGADILAGDPRNAHRFLVSAFGYPTKAPELEWIEIPYKNGQTVPHPFLCPLKWVQKVVDSPEIFVDIMSGPPGDITDFWYNLRNSPLYPHGVAGDKTIAASIHGDSAPTTDVDGLYLFSWSSFHASGSTIAKKIPITVVKSSDVSAETMKTLANRIAWSFNALSSGLMPNQDWLGRDQPDAGSQLCKGWRVANIALRGDWEFIQVFNGQRQCQICAGNARRRHTVENYAGRATVCKQVGDGLSARMIRGSRRSEIEVESFLPSFRFGPFGSKAFSEMPCTRSTKVLRPASSPT